MTKADDLLARAYALTGIDEAETKALYRDWAATYDDTMLEGLGYQSPTKVAALLARQNPALDANILDVGCGTGLLAEHLRALGFANIDGLDFSADMLAEAQRLKRINNAYNRDLNQPLPAPDQPYDYLVSTGTFTHGHVNALCLPELMNWLVDGGMLIATVHQEVWSQGLFDQTIERMQRDGLLKSVDREKGTLFTTDQESTGWYLTITKA